MAQPTFFEQTAPPADPDLDGFGRFYVLLRALVYVQAESTFYERLSILLHLARWQGRPPTIEALARELRRHPDDLSTHLTALRAANWLVSGANNLVYALTPEGRILIVLLQLLAQPWKSGDTAAVAAKFYEVAESLGVKDDLRRAQFDMLLSALEEQVGGIGVIVEAEDTALVGQKLSDSNRNAALAREALDMRREGAVSPDDHTQLQRMHDLLSRLIGLTAELDLRYQQLVARDLLAEGGVTLGDIMEWAREADPGEMAASILPHMDHPIDPVWALPDRALIEGTRILMGQEVKRRTTKLPEPVPPAEVPSTGEIGEIKGRLYAVQDALSQRVDESDPVPLPEWVDRDSWPDAVLHFAAALDRGLAKLPRPIYLHLKGDLARPEARPVGSVTEGTLTRKGEAR